MSDRCQIGVKYLLHEGAILAVEFRHLGKLVFEIVCNRVDGVLRDLSDRCQIGVR